MTKSAVSSSKEKELQQKMAKSIVGTAPSMVPAAPAATLPPEQDDSIPSIDVLITDEDERGTLQKLILQRITVDASIKPLEKVKENLTDRIKTLLGSYGINQLMCDGAKVSYTMTERKSLNQTKLVAAGVDMEIIVACTDISKSGMLKITPPKD